MLHDPTPHRVSACPVHFIWDGKGHGRAFVRAGFMLVLVGCALFFGAKALTMPTLTTPSMGVLAVAAVSWCVGQVLSFFAGRSSARRT